MSLTPCSTRVSDSVGNPYDRRGPPRNSGANSAVSWSPNPAGDGAFLPLIDISTFSGFGTIAAGDIDSDADFPTADQSILPDMIAETVTQGVDPAEAVSRATERMAQLAEELGAFS